MFGRHSAHSREGALYSAPQPLVIHSERDGRAHVVRLIGELDMNTAKAFEDELKRVEATDAGEIIVDLSGLTLIGAEGMKAFIHANARSRQGSKRLTMLPGPDRVHKTFETTGLISLLPFADLAK